MSWERGSVEIVLLGEPLSRLIQILGSKLSSHFRCNSEAVFQLPFSPKRR